MKKSAVYNPIAGGPVPVKTDGRSAFGVAWYDSEAKAAEADRLVRKAGNTYNGGWFHGSPCGRETRFDGNGLFAVTY